MISVSKKNIEMMSVLQNCIIRDVMHAIGRGMLGAAFVVNGDDGSFVQVLTDGDMRKALLKGHGLESPIEVITKAGSVVASEDMNLQEISELFTEKVRIVPVLDKDRHIVSVHYRDGRTKISVTEPSFDEKEVEYVSECVLSGWVSSGGPFVERFEKMMADYCGAQYAVSCSSGTAALHLILLAYGIGAGDEVIVPSLTFIATANAVTYTGAKPVFVDSDPETWNIDPYKIKGSITPRTKAILPVHLYGHPADMDPILDVAKEHDLLVIEDAAEAHGAEYMGRKVGTIGDAGIFSFFGNKIITTGEGGMIVTNNERISERCRFLRDHGMSKERRYWHTSLGYNYRLTNLQAALGVAQLEKIQSIIYKKKNVSKNYEKCLKNIPGITLPPNMEWAKNVFWLYTILIDDKVCGISVEEIIARCDDKGIETRPVFPPIHEQPIYSTGQSLPVAERISATGISLPSSPDISDIMILKVCNVIRKCAGYKDQ